MASKGKATSFLRPDHLLTNPLQEKTCGLTVCVTCVWAGVDSAWEQRKLEARKMLENAAESHTSGARFVGQPFYRLRLSGGGYE
jgi:hypothetical protein